MELNKQNVIRIFKLAAVIILFYVGLQNLSGIVGSIKFLYGLVVPFVAGAAIAFILNVPMRAIERALFGKLQKKRGKKIKASRPVSMILAWLMVLGIIFIVMFIIIPEIAQTIEMIINQIGPALERLYAWLVELSNDHPELSEFLTENGIDIKKLREFSASNIDFDALFMSVLEFLKSGMIGDIVNSTVSVASTIMSGIISAVLSLIFSFYVLIQKEKLARQAKQLVYAVLKEKSADQVIGIARLTEQTFSRFLSGQCLEAVIIGVLFVVTMSIFKFPYAMMIGVMIAFLALIPVVGAFIGCGIGAFLILIVNPTQALWFILLFIIVQQLEGNLIYPHVVGNQVGLPSIWVLVAVSVGGSMMGIAGMLIFIPIFSVIYTISREWVHNRLKNSNVDRDKWRLPGTAGRREMRRRRSSEEERGDNTMGGALGEVASADGCAEQADNNKNAASGSYETDDCDTDDYKVDDYDEDAYDTDDCGSGGYETVRNASDRKPAKELPAHALTHGILQKISQEVAQIKSAEWKHRKKESEK